MLDGTEVWAFGSNPNNTDTDNDLCADGTEVGSVNADRAQNVIDLMVISTHSGVAPGPPYITGLDLDRNGQINVIDLLLSNKGAGSCPPS